MKKEEKTEKKIIETEMLPDIFPQVCIITCDSGDIKLIKGFIAGWNAKGLLPKREEK